MTNRAPSILGVPMRRLRPLRLLCWTWGAPRLSRHLSVCVYHIEGGWRARIWALGIPTCILECTCNDPADGARWAEGQLRGLVEALRALKVKP